MMVDQQNLLALLGSFIIIFISICCGLSILLVGIWRQRAAFVLSGGVLLCGVGVLVAILAIIPRHWWVSLPSIFLGIQSVRVWSIEAKGESSRRIRLSTLLLLVSFIALGLAGVGNIYRNLAMESRVVMQLEQLPCVVGKDLDGIASSVIVSNGTDLDELEIDEILELSSKLLYVRQLQITGHPVSKNGAGLIQSHRNLRVLSLQATNIDDQKLSVFSDLPCLRQLDLMDTDITGGGLIHLHGLKPLRQIWLSRKNISPADVDALQQALPTLNIGY